jgi:hypothetical protein
MKKVFIVLSFSLFLFSCGETNKLEKTDTTEVTDSQNIKDQIVGNWKLKTVGGVVGDGTMTINDDKTFLLNALEGKWLMKDNNFCYKLTGENLPKIMKEEICRVLIIKGGELSLGKEMGVESIYEKVE